MAQHFLQIYFIFALCIFIQENYGSSQENESTESDYLLKYLLGLVAPKTKCESELCSCADFRKFDRVECDQIAGYYISALKFLPHSIKTTSKLQNIPSKILPGYHLQLLYVYDPCITVDENILEEIISLTKFQVLKSGIQLIPDFRFVNDSIKSITIEESHISSLTGKNLQNLILLTDLSFSKNSIQFIDPDVFQGTEEIEELNLSYNLLTSIPPKLLDPMKNLFNFTASYNNLLHVDGLFSNTLPKHIMLQFNNITNANTILHFDVKWKRRQSDAPRPRYRSQFEIEVLDLSYNLLKASSATTVLSCNKNAFYVTPVFRIKVLLLIGNQLENLNTCFKYTRVVEMNVAKNQIEYLTESDFLLHNGTGDLEYRKNQIRRIDNGAFRHARRYLVYLKLSVNKITSINGSVRYLSQLRWLDLSHNSIQSLAEDEFAGLYELFHLSLHHNQITSLGWLQQLNEMQILDINDNDIKQINPEQVPKSLRRINFANNPFTCDCRFQHFIDRVKASENFFKFDTEYCVRSKIEYNTEKKEKCPDRCSCRCTDNTDIPFMFVDCRSRNLAVVPHLFRNYLILRNDTEMTTSNDQRVYVMDQNINTSLHIEDHVYGINFENNNLEFLDEAQLPANLNQIYLSGNKLKRLPESFLDNQINLKQVSLSRNPWICDCSSIKFKTWLTTKNTIIQDIDNIRCGPKEKLSGKIIWKLTDLDLCPPTEKRLVIMVSFCILSFIILCLTAKVLYTRYELHVKVFLYYNGFTFVKEEDVNYNKEFDAFISFSHDDDEFVIKDIISEIENNDPNIRLCVHYRHFMPGEFIQDNITKAVKSSKKTVIILSKNFLNSDWCILEFRTAHAQVMEDKVHRIIVVKLEDLPKEINPIIKVYMDSTTYLTWGESDFWKKLLFILPSRSCVRNPAPRIIGDNDNEMLTNSSFYNV